MMEDIQVVAGARLVAFDWDQTLWNSWDAHVAAAEHAAGTVGVPLPPKARIASTFSLPFVRHLELLFPESTTEATREYMEYYHSSVGTLSTLFHGITQVLEDLKQRDVKLALLSNKRDVYGLKELASTEIGPLFDLILFRADGLAEKPDPQGLREIMGRLSVDREAVLYVGDSDVDVQCARRAGVASAAALWGSVDRKAVLDERPDHVLETPGEVLEVVAGWAG